MAQLVKGALGGHAKIEHLEDPRVEAQEHYYNAAHTKLVDLGLRPHLLDAGVIRSLAHIVEEHQDDIDAEVMLPHVNWRLRSEVSASNHKSNGKLSKAPPRPKAKPKAKTKARARAR